MALEQREKTINGTRYLCTTIPAFRALDVFEALCSTVGPALAETFTKGGLDGDVGLALAALFGRLGGGKLRALAKDLLEGVEVIEDGKKRPMLTGLDVAYAGRIKEVLLVMAFSVEVNFADFFGGSLTDLLAGAASGSASPTA